MHVVLLSGGSGKRLWPLSNDIRSKQFIPLFPQADGSCLSMVQRVFRQIRNVDKNADIIVATSKEQVSTLKNHLGDEVDISVEPCRRDTFPAIVLVSAYLHDVKGLGLDEVVAVCPVDPYVSVDYYKAVQHLTELAVDGVANLMLMGIEPTYPSEKYGYIMPASQRDVSKVASFKEKPTAEKAAEYIEKGALWNSGVFAYQLGYVLDIAHDLLKFEGYYDLYENYGNLTKISFDYAVVEQERSVGVLRYAGEWKDLGTWNTLTEIMREPSIGNVTMAEGCRETNVVNEMDVPILVMGAKNLIVAASPEGILVADKGASSYIKPYVENIIQPIRFAEKSWGSFQIIDVEKESLTIKVTLNAGHGMNYHSHEHRSEVWNVVSGEGTVLLDGQERKVKTGDIVELPEGCRHKVSARTRMTIIEVQMGNAIYKEDKIKWE
ncbi:sugar phosphate nucleotidyltransferase [Selenomonas ruminantium]|uniref:Mannose-1-phosphate guanylyltransferase (GDP) /mannose-6-phosphate isomerase, type 2 n=1 Tax=Selenomonas ruminantium TaxID=971 RepID=A0A1I0XX98_SELRU|nr:sugar phosphate nucleotidyltransferase [Selenomonas ruminantium]SFB05779.1 mannose-1-phosphate guanylyltransferase (GDP) /mannose-6-phosphate isomerase, type 2 [Selenomonas ruminantium]